MAVDLKPVAPMGEQFEINFGEQRAVVTEVGGGLRSYRDGGGELLDGYAADEPCTGARGQSLIPWPNRVGDGEYEFAGEHRQLDLTEPGQHNAIHGFVRWVNWAVAERDEHRLVMAHRLHLQPGWPHALDLRIAYELGEDGLSVSTTATNIGRDACPYGTGAHPYLSLGTETIDPLVLSAPGGSYMLADEQQIPTSNESVEGTKYDFLEPRELGSTVLDTGYADLHRDDDGRARVRLSMPDGVRSVALWLDENYDYLMLFTGDTLPQPERHRSGLGVEPMTCAPNAFQSGDGLITLSPGESITTSWGITPET